MENFCKNYNETKIFDYFFICGLDNSEINGKKTMKEVLDIEPKVINHFCKNKENLSYMIEFIEKM